MSEVFVEDRGAERRERQKNARDTHAEDVRAVMQTTGGRRVLGAIIKRSGFWGSTVCETARETELRSAQRAVGVALWDELGRVCPAERRVMFEEQTNLEETIR